MEIIALTSIIVTLFLVFVIATWREFRNISSPDYKLEKGRPKGGRYTLFNLVEDATKPKLKKIKKQKRRTPMQFGTVSDMESDGVYFKK